MVCVGAIGWAWMEVDLADATLYRGGFFVMALLAAGLILSVLVRRGPVATLLSVGPITAFGRITYGVYVYHWPVYLWLTPARTGLDDASLLAVRVGATVAVAVVSYHLIEMPIRQRRVHRGLPRVRWAVPSAAAALILLAVAVGTRNIEADVVGIDTEPGAPPSPTPAGDGVTDVLVIADPQGLEVAEALRQEARTRPEVDVEVAAPFGCTGAVDAAPEECPSWQAPWSEAVAEHDPDVVLLYVTRWSKEDIASLSGTRDLPSQVEWTAAVLGQGIDLLTDRGATVVWGQDHLEDMAEGLQRDAEPFYQAMLEVTTERSDVQRRPVGARSRGALRGPRPVRPEGRRPPADHGGGRLHVPSGRVRPRALGRVRGGMWWSGQPGRPGCGLADDGALRDPTGRFSPLSRTCQGTEAGLAEAVDRYRPDAVLVLSHVFDLVPRRLEGSSVVLEPGEPGLDRYLVDEYVRTYDTLTLGGAEVVWFTNPCVQPTFGSTALDNLAFETERIQHVNAAVHRRVHELRPELVLFDMFRVLCPDGRFVDDLGGIKDIRPDGVHLSAEGSPLVRRRVRRGAPRPSRCADAPPLGPLRRAHLPRMLACVRKRSIGAGP